MKKIIILVLLLVPSYIYSQSKLIKTATKIEKEGWALYRLERAAWVGTDILREDHAVLMEKLGGYIAYDLGKEVHCIFYNRNQSSPKVIADVIFDPTFNLSTMKVDKTERSLSDLELSLRKAKATATSFFSKDDVFKSYKNTNYNIIPMITKKGAKVVVLTGPSVQGVVVLGNDYEILIDKKWKVKSVNLLHKNIIPIEFDESQKDGVSLHSHLKSTGDFMTYTDVCTLMLYGEYTDWKQHLVMSDKYISIWDCKKNKLLILTKEAWEKIYGKLK